MDLELQPTFAHEYTMNEIEKNLALAEVHAKQFGSVETYFCKDCLRKHFTLIEGLAEEEINFTNNSSDKMKFQRIAELMRIFKNKINQLDERTAFEIADKLRIVRKSLNSSPLVMETTFPEREKHLNTVKQSYINKIDGENMDKQVLMVVGSQFAGRAIQEAETYVERPVMGVQLSTLLNIGGGLLATLAVAFKKVPSNWELPVAIIGTKLLADEVVSQAKKFTLKSAPTSVTMVQSVPSFFPTGALPSPVANY